MRRPAPGAGGGALPPLAVRVVRQAAVLAALGHLGRRHGRQEEQGDQLRHGARTVDWTRYRVRGYLGDSIKGHLHADNKNGQEFPYFYSKLLYLKLDINERRAQTVQVNTLLKQPNPFTHTRRKNTKNIAALSEAIKAAQFRAGRLDAWMPRRGTPSWPRRRRRTGPPSS